jgi:TPR repeat protein
MKRVRDIGSASGAAHDQPTPPASHVAPPPTNPLRQPILRSKNEAPAEMSRSDLSGAQVATSPLAQPILNSRSEALQGMPQIGGTPAFTDEEVALQLFKLAVAGDAEAQCDLGLLYAKGRGVERNMETALAWLQQSAEQDNTLALSNLHLAYSEGLGVTKDAGKATEYLHACANLGDEVAQYRLGVAYWTGQGVLKNAETAVAWLRKSADQGYAVAQLKLGDAYWTGQGVPENLQTAVEWYKKSADQGNAVAQLQLGAAYWNGQGVPKNAETAVAWFRKSADQGNAVAHGNMGTAYWTGQGVPKNAETAVAWLRKSADQGDAVSQLRLGVAYWTGQGVPKNLQTAVEWYKKSADQGHAVAQFGLGRVYASGQGVPKNLETGVEYFFQSVRTTGKLDLSSAIVSDELIIAIAQTLKRDNTVTNLIINKANQITDAGAMAIAQALELNTSLRELPDYEAWVKNDEAKHFIGLHLSKNRKFADTVKNYRDHPVTTTQGFPPELIGLLEEAVFRTFQKTLKVDCTAERASSVVDQMSHILATEPNIEVKRT